MDIYSEGGLIFLVMVDHLNGELLGGVIDSFYAAGEDPETIGKAEMHIDRKQQRQNSNNETSPKRLPDKTLDGKSG